MWVRTFKIVLHVPKFLFLFSLFFFSFPQIDSFLLICFLVKSIQ